MPCVSPKTTSSRRREIWFGGQRRRALDRYYLARDIVSRWDVLGVYGRATAGTARDFLDTVIERMPGPVKAIQVDGGSEFRAEFEAACEQKGLRLFVLPPCSPRLNGCVERAQRTHKEEFTSWLTHPTRSAN